MFLLELTVVAARSEVSLVGQSLGGRHPAAAHDGFGHELADIVVAQRAV